MKTRLGITVVILFAAFVMLLLVSRVAHKPAHVVTAMPVSTPSLLPTITPVIGQYEFYSKDTGKTAVIPLATKFQLMLSETQNPKSMLHVSCNPDTLLQTIGNIPSVPKPLYVVSLQAKVSGICTITDTSFYLKLDFVQE
ncbi:MAG: hypothetical protein KGL95_04815 [Patescibacteria group bacterium]|nr:hypothetical protein [Patescibacteria group bacterium]